jgi:hypothetical protein
MADVDISGATDSVAVAEVLARMMDINARSVAQSAAAVAEALTVGAPNTQLFRGTQAATVGGILTDYELISSYPRFNTRGFKLKGLILIPGSGGPDTFSIKDGSDTGPYLYYAAVTAATVLVFPGTLCFPYIDASECTVTAGHLVTFLWE